MVGTLMYRRRKIWRELRRRKIWRELRVYQNVNVEHPTSVDAKGTISMSLNQNHWTHELTKQIMVHQLTWLRARSTARRTVSLSTEQPLTNIEITATGKIYNGCQSSVSSYTANPVQSEVPSYSPYRHWNLDVAGILQDQLFRKRDFSRSSSLIQRYHAIRKTQLLG